MQSRVSAAAGVAVPLLLPLVVLLLLAAAAGGASAEEAAAEALQPRLAGGGADGGGLVDRLRLCRLGEGAEDAAGATGRNQLGEGAVVARDRLADH